MEKRKATDAYLESVCVRAQRWLRARAQLIVKRRENRCLEAQKISKMEVVEAEPPELPPVNHVFLAGRQGHLFSRASRLHVRALTSSIRAPESRLYLDIH